LIEDRRKSEKLPFNRHLRGNGTEVRNSSLGPILSRSNAQEQRPGSTRPDLTRLRPVIVLCDGLGGTRCCKTSSLRIGEIPESIECWRMGSMFILSRVTRLGDFFRLWGDC
jgi:hypothetical protein